MRKDCNELIKVLIPILRVVVCVMLLDAGIGLCLNSLISRLPCEGERVAKSNYVINKVDAEIVVVGSSRAEAHYDSHILIDSFPDWSVFNCGVDGQHFYYADIVVNSILDRYTPKVLIWDFQLKDLVVDEKENLSLLYPYYYINDYIRESLDCLEPSLRYKIWFNAYRYNGTAGRIIRALSLPNSLNHYGFESKVGRTDRVLVMDDFVIENQIIDSQKVAALNKTISRLKEMEVKTFLVVSPMFRRVIGESPSLPHLVSLDDGNRVFFINDSQLQEFIHQTDLMYDDYHLNTSGAAKFTTILVNQLKSRL